MVRSKHRSYFQIFYLSVQIFYRSMQSRNSGFHIGDLFISLPLCLSKHDEPFGKESAFCLYFIDTLLKFASHSVPNFHTKLVISFDNQLSIPRKSL